MTYQTFAVLDFVNDDGFLKHQLSPNELSEAFWQNWLQQYPEKQQEWQQAKTLVEAVRLGLSDYANLYISADTEAQLLTRIQKTITAGNQARIIPIWQKTWFIAAAACVVLIIGIVFWKTTTSPNIYEQQMASENNLTEKINDTAKPQVVHLPDGSAVILASKSKISYLKTFENNIRKVYLQGEATFDIVKNPSKPFLVYSNELITKVIGTKFIITAFEKDKNVMVRVIQGQVSVYRNQTQNAQTLKGVLLLPNQQVIFERKSEHFTKSIIENPALIASKEANAIRFEFDETPVSIAFERIEKAYSIDIIFDKEMLKNCQITSSLTEESLFQKLDIITQSIGASYQMVDGQIVITAVGCQ
jgi:transmembrane sensor